MIHQNKEKRVKRYMFDYMGAEKTVPKSSQNNHVQMKMIYCTRMFYKSEKKLKNLLKSEYEK